MESDLPRQLWVDTTGDFAALRRRGMLYVDKTETIARLVGPAGGLSIFFARPRRFGKSLLVSTLAELFRGSEPLFAGMASGADATWIHRQGAWDWSEDNRSPVIRLNLNVTGVHSVALLAEDLHHRIRRLCQAHGVPALPDDTRLHPAHGLRALVEDVHARTGREVVVLVDEYDAPITANLGRPIIEDVLDLMRTFYGALKDCAGIMRFLFMTGITRFARTGLFSGANHLRDLSLHPGFHDLAGITTYELEGATIGPYVKSAAQVLGLPEEDVRAALAAYYNGYRFGPAPDPVYNPFSVLHCLQDMIEPETAAEIRDRGLRSLPNYWASSGSPSFLVRALTSGAYDLARLPRNTAQIEQVTYQIDPPDFAALMHQTGYLTRKGSRERGWRLDFPNREVQTTFTEIVVLGRENRLPQLDHTLHDAVAQAVLTADPDALTGAFAACLAGLGYPLQPPAALPEENSEGDGKTPRGWIQRWDHETHYQALLCNTLRMAGMPPWTETPTARGRIDAAVDGDNRVYVFEIKLNRSAEAALRQACTGDYPGLFAATRKAVTVIGLNIDTRARTVESCWVKDLGRYRMATARWEREPFGLSLRELALAGEEAAQSLAFRLEGLSKDRTSAADCA